jgi:hypothetical protein
MRLGLRDSNLMIVGSTAGDLNFIQSCLVVCMYKWYEYILYLYAIPLSLYDRIKK